MKPIILMTLFMASAAGVQAQTNFYTTVTNLWYQGQKSNVLAMADSRLQQNTNDMAALLIKVEFDIDFTQRHSVSNSMQRALDVGQSITTPHFSQVFPFYKECLLWTLDEVKDNPLTGAALQAEQAKGNFNHFPFSAKKELEALLKDGYFD